MAQYGEVRVDYITYTTGTVPTEANATVTVSSLVNDPTFSGDVQVGGDVTITGNLNVSGDSLFDGITVSGNSILNTLTVTGGSNLEDVEISGTLTVTGNTNLNNLTVTGNTNVNNLTVTGITVLDNLVVSGDTTVSGDLTVEGDINASGVTISGITGLFASGTAGTPSISFVGDQDTGFFNYEANGVGITTSGIQRFAMNADGHVSVGNTETVALSDRGFNIRNDADITLCVATPSGTVGSGTLELRGTTLSSGQSNQVFLEAGQDQSAGLDFRATRFDLKVRNTSDAFDNPTQRLSVLASGYFGVNVPNPSGYLQIGGPGGSGTARLRRK